MTNSVPVSPVQMFSKLDFSSKVIDILLVPFSNQYISHGCSLSSLSYWFSGWMLDSNNRDSSSLALTTRKSSCSLCTMLAWPWPSDRHSVPRLSKSWTKWRFWLEQSSGNWLRREWKVGLSSGLNFQHLLQIFRTRDYGVATRDIHDKHVTLMTDTCYSRQTRDTHDRHVDIHDSYVKLMSDMWHSWQTLDTHDSYVTLMTDMTHHITSE